MYRRSATAQKLFSTENELDRFDLLTDAAFAAGSFPPECRTYENRLLSCETKTWYLLSFDGEIRLSVESDSLFVKGLCAVLSDIAKTVTAADVSKKIGFADECRKKGIIDINRHRGLLSLEEKIISFAKEVYKNEKSH